MTLGIALLGFGNVANDHTNASLHLAVITANLNPIQDTFDSALYPNQTRGGWPVLRISSSPTEHVYIRFAVPSGTVSAAMLRLYVTSAGGGFTVNPVASDTWSGSTLTYNNAPALGSPAINKSTARATGWTSVDVTTAIHKSGHLNLALTAGGGQQVALSSGTGSNPPQLVLIAASPKSSRAAAPAAPTPLSGAKPVPIPGATPAPAQTAVPHATASTTFDVTKAPYNCVGDGVTDCYAGANAAVADAQKAGPGSEVYFPLGTFVFKTPCPNLCSASADIRVPAGNSIVMEGSGRTTTHLINKIYNRSVLGVAASGSVIENLDLDASGRYCGALPNSCEGADAFSGGGDPGIAQTGQNITLQHFFAEGSPLHYAVRLASWSSATQSSGCPQACDSGNKIIDGVVNGVITDSDIDLAFQLHATVANITFTGDRVGCYVCTDVAFTGIAVAAGQQTYHDGWVCTQCNGVTFDHFTMGAAVRGGKIERDACYRTCGNRDLNTNITISNEVMTSANNILEIGDVQGLLVANSIFTKVNVVPYVLASGTWVNSTPTSGGCGTSPGLVSIAGFACR